MEKENEGEGTIEIFYLQWMEAVIRQDRGKQYEMRKRVKWLWEHVEEGNLASEKRREILLNIAYTDPELSAKQWMELLEKQTKPGRPVRRILCLGNLFPI